MPNKYKKSTKRIKTQEGHGVDRRKGKRNPEKPVVSSVVPFMKPYKVLTDEEYDAIPWDVIFELGVK
jgi:hypothetical protein